MENCNGLLGYNTHMSDHLTTNNWTGLHTDLHNGYCNVDTNALHCTAHADNTNGHANVDCSKGNLHFGADVGYNPSNYQPNSAGVSVGWRFG